jgi:hypothetical protein
MGRYQRKQHNANLKRKKRKPRSTDPQQISVNRANSLSKWRLRHVLGSQFESNKSRH